MPVINTQITETTNIIENGTYDVARYTTAIVNTPAAPESYRAFQLNGTGKLVNSTSTPWVPLPAGTTDLCDYCFSEAYKFTPANVLSGEIDLSSLTNLSGTSSLSMAFYGCVGITSVDLGSLIEVSGSTALYAAFSGCSNITHINMSSLMKVTSSLSNLCTNCYSLPSMVFSSLTLITGNSALSSVFQNCTSLTTLSFPSITIDSFGSRTNQFNNMFNANVNGCTIHFPNNLQAKITTMSGYPNFGGTNTAVLFDLPATNTLTGADTNIYTRNPKYDTATALAWKVGAYGTTNFTPVYYTSGTTDPVINDTIYSDAACTTLVTTIDSVV